MVIPWDKLLVFHLGGVARAVVTGGAALEPDGTLLGGGKVSAVDGWEAVGCLLATSDGLGPG